MSEAIIISPEKPCPISFRGSAVVIGNFDGVHLGHQALIKQALSTNLKVVALTFQPHPRSFFSGKPIFELTSMEEKKSLLSKLGVSALAVCPFNDALAKLSPQSFIDKILINWLGAKYVLTGEGFRFGHKREGDGELLSQQFFHYIAVPPVLNQGLPVSSSRIRAALSEPDLSSVKSLLGRDYAVTGVVIHGAKQGRKLGYPTANIALSSENGLKQGVYAVFVEVDGIKHKGVCSYGRRPMFDNGALLLESFLFDFKGDLYGKTIKVTLIAYLRAELNFASVDELIAQMNNDSLAAKKELENV